jgi:hypothetical protein
MSKKVNVLDEYGNFSHYMPLQDALLAESRGEMYCSSNRAKTRPTFRKKVTLATHPSPSPCTLVQADTFALESVLDGKRIPQQRWERLSGYGFTLPASLMAPA